MMQRPPVNTCPVCGGKSVTFNKCLGSRKYLPSLFRCRDCNVELNALPTWQVLWAILLCFVFAALGLALIARIDRVLRAAIAASDFIVNSLVIAAAGAILLGIYLVSIRIACRGLRFVVTRPHL